MQERSGRLDAREVSPFGHPGHRDRAWDAPAGLERRDDGREAPGVPRRMPCWCSTREAVGVCGHRLDIFRTDHVRRWGRTDHRAAPTAVGVLTSALLAWKERLAGFSVGLTEPELRSVILLGILALVVYPALPPGPIDPWHVVDLRVAWMTVILTAGIGFTNYVLRKLYGNRGIELTGFLGGLVNSSVTVTELANRHRETHGQLADVVYRGTMLATAAMVLRNAVLLGILAPMVLLVSAVPLALMCCFSLALAFFPGRCATTTDASERETPTLRLASPRVTP
jgi:uncharacterized membrane protein (DUF4010 family)